MANIQNQIDRIDSQITAINDEIALIDAESPTDSSVQDCLDQRKTQLQNRLSSLNNTKTNLQTVQTQISAGFDAGQQTVIDGINTLFSNNYSRQLNRLKRMKDEKKTEFFTVYAAAETDFARETVIKAFFRIN